MNFDFSHLKSPPFPKLILLDGLGMGKSTIRNLLEDEYRRQGIECLTAYSVKELTSLNRNGAFVQSKHRPVHEHKENFEGVIFLELNQIDLPVLPFVPIYAIYFPSMLHMKTSVNMLPDSTIGVTSKP